MVQPVHFSVLENRAREKPHLGFVDRPQPPAVAHLVACLFWHPRIASARRPRLLPMASSGSDLRTGREVELDSASSTAASGRRSSASLRVTCSVASTEVATSCGSPDRALVSCLVTAVWPSSPRACACLPIDSDSLFWPSAGARRSRRLARASRAAPGLLDHAAPPSVPRRCRSRPRSPVALVERFGVFGNAPCEDVHRDDEDERSRSSPAADRDRRTPPASLR